jgi:hypothetical protein
MVTATIYSGSSLTNPNAGGGLVRVVSSTNTVSVTGAAGTFQTIPLLNAVDYTTGQIFYAAILIRGVPGTLFPFASDAMETPAVTPLGRSFFDVGPTQGAPYNLDVTTNATVMGGTHPVVDGAQDPGNAGIRVNAVVPEPSSMFLGAMGVGLFIRQWRRKRA